MLSYITRRVVVAEALEDLIKQTYNKPNFDIYNCINLEDGGFYTSIPSSMGSIISISSDVQNFIDYNITPSIFAIVNDLCNRGLIEPGEYVILPD